MRSRLWLVLVLAPVLMATSCPPRVVVDVQPGAAAAEPRFLFRYQGKALRALDSLKVFGCPDRVVHGTKRDSALERTPPAWALVRDTAAAGTAPLRISYGRVPVGHRETSPAQPLRPGGCYYVHAALRDTAFAPTPIMVRGGRILRLLPDGRMIVGVPVVPLLEPRTFRELNRASVGCGRGYRRARTPAARQAVDAREYTVMGNHLSCAWLNTHWPDVMSERAPTERTVFGLLGIAALAGLALIDGAEQE